MTYGTSSPAVCESYRKDTAHGGVGRPECPESECPAECPESEQNAQAECPGMPTQNAQSQPECPESGTIIARGVAVTVPDSRLPARFYHNDPKISFTMIGSPDGVRGRWF